MLRRPEVMSGVQNFARVMAIVRRPKSSNILYDGCGGLCIACAAAAMDVARGDGSHHSGFLKLARQF